MLKIAGDPIAILYGLSALDAVNQIAFAVGEDARARPDRYGPAASEVVKIAAASDAGVVKDLDKRTKLYESISGSRDGTLSPLALAEFTWRDAAMALAKAEGQPRAVASVMYARSAESFREFCDSTRHRAQRVVDRLLVTFDASSRILADPGVAAAFDVEPLPPDWVVNDDTGYAAAQTIAALSEELDPAPFGRLSPYEVQLLKRLAVRRRTAVEMFARAELDPAKDASAIIDWAQALEEFQVASAARSMRGQRTDDPRGSRPRVIDIQSKLLSARVRDFLTACAGNGT